MALKKICALFLTVIMLASFLCSCELKDGDTVAYWLMSSVPVNLDPQTANGADETLIIKNCFDTLFKRDDKGELVPGALESYGVSDSGLKYVFTLRDDTYWCKITKGKIEKYAKVCADDYVFAIQRLFTDNRQSNIMSTLSYIKNAQSVLNGADVSKLSVKAEGERTFSIVLSKKNDSFLEVFSDYRLSPCCREFFSSTNGRYGLSPDKLVFNGSFLISSLGESFAKLVANKFYHDGEPKLSSAVLYLPKSTRNSLSLLKSQDIDAAFLSAEEYNKISTNENLNFKKDAYAVWVLLLNDKNELWQNEKLRRAVYLATDRSCMQLEKDSHLSEQNSLVPENISVFSENYRTLAPNVKSEYLPQSAKVLCAEALSELGLENFFNMPVLIPDSEMHKNAFSYLNQVYQRDLSLYFSPTYLDSDEILKKVSQGDFSAALVPIYLSYDSPMCILESFLPGFANCIFPFGGAQYASFISNAAKATDPKTAAENYSAAEALLLKSSAVIPIYTESRYFAYQKNTSGFVTTFSGEILFKDVIKK